MIPGKDFAPGTYAQVNRAKGNRELRDTGSPRPWHSLPRKLSWPLSEKRCSGGMRVNSMVLM
jgi:hypothetical protein